MQFLPPRKQACIVLLRGGERGVVFLFQSKPQTKSDSVGATSIFRLPSALPSQASPFQKPFASDNAALKRCAGATRLLSADCKWETILVCLLCLLCESLSTDALLLKCLTTDEKILGSSVPAANFYIQLASHSLLLFNSHYHRCGSSFKHKRLCVYRLC